jgi:hypothetical protein
LKHNLQKTKRPETIILIIDSIVERLGKISRFFRAASAFTAIGMRLLENGKFRVYPLQRLRSESSVDAHLLSFVSGEDSGSLLVVTTSYKG